MDRRALIITYYFPPLGGGGVQRMAKLVKYASRLGWHFTVITADEPTHIIPTDPTLNEDIPDSVRVRRIPFPGWPGAKRGFSALTQTAGFFKRYISAWLYVPDSRKKWLEKAWPRIRHELQSEKYDVVLISIPPYSLSFLAQAIKKEFTLPVILDLRDPWSMNPYKIYPTPLHRIWDRRTERRIIANISYGISAYRRLLDYYGKTVPGFKADFWQVIPNGFDRDDFEELGPVEMEKKATFDIAFSGTVYSHINHPTPLFKAMARLRREHSVPTDRLRFVFVGKAHIDLKKLAGKFALQDQLSVRPYLPHRQSLRVLQRADVLCVILDDRDPRSAYTVGGKVYEYLALKKPILALVPPDGEAADLIRATASGIVVSPQNIGGIAQVLKRLMQDDGPPLTFNGIEEFDRQRQAQAFIRFFEKVVASAASSR